jgi:BlaI family transcriptional regulator, penicillinase repressor
MPRHPSPEPTERELDILRVLWESGPCSLSDVAQRLEAERGIATTTVATILKVMLDKNLVAKTDDRRWKALVSRKNTGRSMVRRLLDRVYDGSAQRLVAHVLEDEQLSPSAIAELQSMLDRHLREAASSSPEKKEE